MIGVTKQKTGIRELLSVAILQSSIHIYTVCMYVCICLCILYTCSRNKIDAHYAK